ncbi:MAG: hypothetical protein ABSB81_11510, partial [Halobacteriota archaeon]
RAITADGSTGVLLHTATTLRAARALIIIGRESHHSPTIPVRYNKSLRHGRDELSQKKTGVFVTGTNNALYEWTDITGWLKLGGYLTSSLGARSRSSGKIDVFVRGGDNGLWQLSYNNGAWETWTSIGGV